ncbi:hypothetical protein IGI04_015922 [Brassica rapa subsp. trilocularis]|uniref:Uncharacterized protein n=1 Tax=Brassica rapa subsp. trilocularis TaxID=1813537 RepID=A0ABQ7MRW8_BRACM|nr:hypothetical protein IGI04_015922 [Brassica rapa subsp. trilocularis]
MRSSPLESLSFPHTYIQCEIISDWIYIGVLSTTFGLHTTVNVSVDDFQIITWVQPAITTTPISSTSTSSYSVALEKSTSVSSHGEIVPLSLQMHDCKVLQKALDVIEPDQRVLLGHELDGQPGRVGCLQILEKQWDFDK